MDRPCRSTACALFLIASLCTPTMSSAQDAGKAATSQANIVPSGPPAEGVASAQSRPSFAVATIKPSDPAHRGGSWDVKPDGHFIANNFALTH